MNKNETIKKFQKLLKKQYNFKSYDKNFNINKEYQGEKYAIINTRNENTNVLENIIFVDTPHEYDTVLQWSTAYRSVVVNLETFEVETELHKPIRP